MRFTTMWYVRPAKAQTSLRVHAVWSEPLLVAWIFYDGKSTDEQHLEFLSLKRDCTGSTLVKKPHCWKSRVTAHICMCEQRKRKSVSALEHMSILKFCWTPTLYVYKYPGRLLFNISFTLRAKTSLSRFMFDGCFGLGPSLPSFCFCCFCTL